ncbi:TRAP transporter substrate-binding protein [Chakrabartyella piscis]|uniref:TRAP transporter substrate-binding protein n=1 Tax=Chakrabartyella piscis TaxID=2918914 RepID=UPI002958454A|nr:TRAP transporter substrate-binding protein [Chakrabartyella piscis]
MKKYVGKVAAVMAMTMVLSACGGSSATESAAPAADSSSDAATEVAADAVVIKLGTTVNEEDSFQVAAEKFAEIVEAETNGAYVVEIYPNGTLGDERTMLESMQMGTLDMGIITSGPFVNFVPEMGVLDMPFLFASNEEAYKVLDGEVGQELFGLMEGVNLKGLSYAERGFRNLTNSKKAVESLDDLSGLKIRVMENEVYLSTFESLGVNAVPMAWSEALTALQQGTIDGQENPVNVIYSYKLWESQDQLTMTRHTYASAIMTMSLAKFNSLPEDVQTIFEDAAQEAAEYERQWIADGEAEMLAEIIANGVTVIEDIDMDAFKAAVQPTYDAYGAEYADWMAKIEAVLAE